MSVVETIAGWLMVVVEAIELEEEVKEEEDDEEESVAKATNPEAESVGERDVSVSEDEEFVAIAVNPRLAGSLEDEIMTERKVVDGGGGAGIVPVSVSVAASAVGVAGVDMDGDCVPRPSGWDEELSGTARMAASPVASAGDGVGVTVDDVSARVSSLGTEATTGVLLAIGLPGESEVKTPVVSVGDDAACSKS